MTSCCNLILRLVSSVPTKENGCAHFQETLTLITKRKALAKVAEERLNNYSIDGLLLFNSLFLYTVKQSR